MRHQWRVGTWDRAIRTLGVLAMVFLCSGCAGLLNADGEAAAARGSAPVRLDPEKLAGVGLEEYPAMSAEEVLEGGTGQRGEVFFLGDELAVGVWEADASTLAVSEPFVFEEFVTVLSGKLILTDEQGNATEYAAGESVVIPKGFSGTWQMLGDFREIYVMEKEAFMRTEGSE